MGNLHGNLILIKMITLLRTDSANKEFISLVSRLDAELAGRDGAEHAFYAQFNKIDMLRQVVVAHKGKLPVGCGAIKAFDSTAMEVKRMYVMPGFRAQGVASRVLLELEKWAVELGFQKCVLETGLRQPEAIALYTKNGYNPIPNYGQYAGMENSRCFEKFLVNISRGV